MPHPSPPPRPTPTPRHPLPTTTTALVRIRISVAFSSLTIAATLCLLAVRLLASGDSLDASTPAAQLMQLWEASSSSWFLPPVAALLLLHGLTARVEHVTLAVVLGIVAWVLVLACSSLPAALHVLSHLWP